MTIKTSLKTLHNRIIDAQTRYGRQEDTIELLAVSKTRSIAEIQAAIHANHSVFGENYCQEAVEKIKALVNYPLQWHFIGHIQRNKTKHIAQHFSWVHSVCCLSIAKRLSEQRPPHLANLNICLQINTSGEHSKDGFTPQTVSQAIDKIAKLPRLTLRGLMTIPAPCTNLDEQRKPYRALANLLSALNTDYHLSMDTLSMGMSNDLEAAIAEGATIVRVGHDIFGPRLASPQNIS